MHIFRGIVSTAEFSAVFYLDSHKASNGKTKHVCLMTRDGFILPAMEFTGEKVMQIH